MQTLGDTSQHVFLVKRMARATGAAVQTLDEEEWAATVTRCRGCTCVEACKSWLDALELSGEGPQPAPLDCENRALMQRLGQLADRGDF